MSLMKLSDNNKTPEYLNEKKFWFELLNHLHKAVFTNVSYVFV
jgi:hypothetical protein